MNRSLLLLLNALHSGHDERWLAIDVGAHEGSFSRSLLDCGMFASVIAFEPHPDTFKRLVDNVPRSDGFKAVNIALDAETRERKLYSDENSATASLLHYGSDYQNRGDVSAVDVSTIRLDDFLADSRPTDHLKLLKVDTQGNDLSVLRGAIETIVKYKPIVQVEFIYADNYVNQCSPDDITSFFEEEFGYKLFTLADIHVDKNGRLAFCDAIFAHRSVKFPLGREFTCIDDHTQYESQIAQLGAIAAERLALIERLSDEIEQERRERRGFLHHIRRLISRF